eukprot:Anaeramoba_ignava/a99740_15.p1 GENE.a99740_15~~a99740_15.p1  ORF type:complete len:326 (+),score=70.26 a99740_15:112-1089(+)
MQICVVFSLWYTLDIILAVDLKITIGACVGYALVCLFYLTIFYSVMMKKEVRICGINLREQLRSRIYFRTKNGTKIMILDSKWYLIGYIVLFIAMLILSIVAISFLSKLQYQKMDQESSLNKSIFAIFLLMNISAIITFAGFILNVAFHPVTRTEMLTNDGKIVDLNTFKYFAIARSFDRTILAKFPAQNDPHQWAIDIVIQNEVKSSSNKPGFQKFMKCTEYSLFQQNDSYSMLFLATGPLFNPELSFHLLNNCFFQLNQQVYNHNTLLSFNLLHPNSLFKNVHNFLPILITKFFDKNNYQNLLLEARNSVNLLQKIFQKKETN